MQSHSLITFRSLRRAVNAIAERNVSFVIAALSLASGVCPAAMLMGEASFYRCKGLC